MILISRILLLRILQVRISIYWILLLRKLQVMILILLYWILLLRKLQVRILASRNLWINFHSIIGNNEDISAIGSCLKIEDIENIDIDIENINIENIVDQLKWLLPLQWCNFGIF